MPLRAWRSSFCTTSLWLLRPMPGAAQTPAVDDVADQIDRLGLVMAQEIDQELGLRRLRAEVDVGDEQCTEIAWCSRRTSSFPTVAARLLCPDSCNRRVTVAVDASRAIGCRVPGRGMHHGSRHPRQESHRLRVEPGARQGLRHGAGRSRLRPRRQRTRCGNRSPRPRRKSATALASRSPSCRATLPIRKSRKRCSPPARRRTSWSTTMAGRRAATSPN